MSKVECWNWIFVILIELMDFHGFRIFVYSVVLDEVFGLLLWAIIENPTNLRFGHTSLVF